MAGRVGGEYVRTYSVADKWVVTEVYDMPYDGECMGNGGRVHTRTAVRSSVRRGLSSIAASRMPTLSIAVPDTSRNRHHSEELHSQEQLGIERTHQLATLLNCSSRFRGRKVMIVYLDVITWFVV